MAILTQITGPTQVYIHMETTNQSFINMHYYLKRCGRIHNDFFLVLYDPYLAGVDPRDPNLNFDMKMRVLAECKRNYWYFLREVLRIPIEGDPTGRGAQYELNRANLAMNYLFEINYNFYLEIPRQTGKSTGMMSRFLWVYNFGTTNSAIALLHKDHSGSKDNLATLVKYRDALPSYLQMSSAVGMDGKKLKVKNTVVTIQHPLNNNRIVTFASARSKDTADKMCRGMTVPLQYYDEFGFMPYNEYAYLAAMPAFSRASRNAELNHAPHGVYITTTPGDLTTDSGRFCYFVRNNCSEWSEEYYDYSYEKLQELKNANTKSDLFLIRYTYKQLGLGNEYFNNICVQMQNKWDKIRREVLLEWSEIADDCAFRKEDLEVIEKWCREPIRTLRYGRAGQYIFKIYEDLDPRYAPILGVDVAGATYRDSSAITIIDSKTTKVTATFNCNFIPSDELAELLYQVVRYKIPNGIINIERNGGYGKAIIDRLKKTSIKKNLYYELKERVISETVQLTGGIRQNKQIVKVYGLDSGKEVRARLIELLQERVQYHKDKFVDKTLLNEMKAMVVKKSGKVEHSNLTHDDQVFSYLMALYVWYDGKNLAQNFGIMKNTIMTDEFEELAPGELEAMEEERENIDFDLVDMEENEDMKEQLEFIKAASRRQSRVNFERDLQLKELEERENSLVMDPIAKKAYCKKYNIDPNGDSNVVQTIKIPDHIFMSLDDDDEDMARQQHVDFHGDLYDDFINLF